MLDLLRQPWPWYVAGPIIGLMVPVLLLVGGKLLGISANLRHLCALSVPGRLPFLNYDWKKDGRWNLTFLLGLVVGGFVGTTLLASPSPEVAISAATKADLLQFGLTDFTGLVPSEWISFGALATWQGWLMIVGGGFLVGFGARYAGGCTSGHAISGLAALQLPSLVAVLGFFAGGLFVTFVVLPLLF